MPLFNHEIENLSREGAIYADHWIEELGDFRHVRIRFKPEEIEDYVRRITAFDTFLRSDAERAADVEGIPDDVARDADSYTMLDDGQEITPWYCVAAFLGPHLEALTCTNMRAEIISDLVERSETPAYARSLEQALSLGEGQNIEFKREFKSALVIAKEVAAFSTSNNGVLLLGVDDSGHVIGTDKTKEDIENALTCVGPLPTYGIEFSEHNGSRIAIVRVKKGRQPVYYAKHSPYLRQGSKSRPLEPHEVYELIEQHIASRGS